MSMPYTPIFVPRPHPGGVPAIAETLGDRAPGALYVFTDEISLAVNVALATGRPLLVRGTSGSGKTSLARSVAANMKWEFRETVITAGTQARDLLWTVDSLRRLQDAQLGRISPDWRSYIVPGALWWAFDPSSAAVQASWLGPSPGTPPAPAGRRRNVLLLDEIDKADPDVPNSLLRPIGDLAFAVEETGERIAAGTPAPLIIITTNEERDLPPAFTRRCVELNMPAFDHARLLAIGRVHFPTAEERLLSSVAELVLHAGQTRDRRAPNAAEYLDVLRACTELAITPESASFRQLSAITLGVPALRGA